MTGGIIISLMEGKMKLIKTLSVLIISLILAACGIMGVDLPKDEDDSAMQLVQEQEAAEESAEIEISDGASGAPAAGSGMQAETIRPINICGVIIYGDTEEADLSGIDLKGVILSGVDLDGILDSFPNLKKLYLLDCGLSNDEYAALQDRHPGIRMIWEIRLSHWKIRTDRVAFSTMKNTSQEFFMIDDEAKYFKYCTDMEALDLGHNHLTNVEFLKYMPKLKILILVDNMRFFKDGHAYYIYDLSPVANCTELRYLEFFCNSCSDLSFLQYTPKIRHLNISYNPIRDDQMQYLYGFPELKRLWMEHTKVSYAAFQKLENAYPYATLIYEGEGSIDHGWREIQTYYNMRDCFNNNYINPEFAD